MEKLVRFGISMEQGLLESFDSLISHQGYSNRSEAIRDIVREKLVTDAVTSPSINVFGALVYIYDHHKRDLEKSLSSLQHDFFHIIIFTTHVHVDPNNCLEVLLLKGKAGVITTLAEKLLGIKGVQHGKLTITTLVKSAHRLKPDHAHKSGESS